MQGKGKTDGAGTEADRSISVKVRLIRSFDFEAAHYLKVFPEGHPCRGVHGHSYRVEVIVSGPVDPQRGYLMDFGQIKAAIEPVRQRLDHCLLNEIPGLENPTAEMLARWIYQQLKVSLPMLEAVRVHETAGSAVEYRGEE